jgi:RNA polymerase primary sigma factor
MTSESNQSAGDGIYIGSLFEFLDEEPDTGTERRFEELLDQLKHKTETIQARWNKTNYFHFETLFPGYDWIANTVYGVPILLAREERVLFERYFDTGDIAIRNLLVCYYLKLVISIVKHFSRPVLEYEKFLDFDDLFQEGVLGLLEAVDRFDLSTGYRFTTYAHWWIRQKIQASLSGYFVVRVPVNRQDMDSNIKQKIARIEQKLGRSLSAEELSQKLDIKEGDAERILFNYASRSSYIDVLNLSENEMDVIVTDETWHLGDTFDLFTETYRKQELLNILQEILDNREIEIVKAYYGFLGDGGRTLEDIGTSLRLTRERVRQILKKALGKLERHLSRNPLLKIPN